MQTGLLPGGGGQTMGSMRIDAKDFPFMYYLGMLKSRVSENWIPPFGSFEADNKRVVIAFRIDRRGQLLTSQVEETSGDAFVGSIRAQGSYCKCPLSTAAGRVSGSQSRNPLRIHL